MVGWDGTGAVHPLGAGLALSAAVVYALFIPLIDRLRAGVTAVVATAWVAVGATVIFLVAAGIARQLVLPAESLSWLWIIGLGTISTAVAFSLFLHGLEALGPMTAAIVTTAEPFFVAILAALVLNQPIRVQTVIGGSLIAIAVLILQLHHPTDPHPKEGF
jgi:drug/metabolite transporter (DMT)-like permease